MIILDHLPSSAHDQAADFQSALGDGVELEIRVVGSPMLGFPEPTTGVTVIVSPQSWDELTPEIQSRSDVELLTYDIEDSDCARLGEVLRNPGPAS